MDFNLRKALIAMFAILISTVTFSQSIYNNNTAVEGKVIDGNSFPISGAEVQYVGNKDIKTLTDDDGTFRLEVPAGKGMIEVYSPLNGTKQVSFEVEESSTLVLYPITLNGDEVSLDELVVVGRGVIDIATDRETPVAVSTIKYEDIQNKLGNLEFPEVLKTTPSIYVTKQGGGYGDSRINVRGFNQRNTAIIINGQPVNDMENGWVYWSNWQGLSEVASAIQVQRGLGASKLAVPSVGGTINVITKSTDKEQGGRLQAIVGNDGYLKTVASYSTGMNTDGWAASFLVGRWQGDGYVDGTEGEGYTYFATLGYRPNDKHEFNFNLAGAGQWHNQRSMQLSLYDYENYGGDDFRKFNADWGLKDGDEYSYRRNFYNKPIASLNWDWDISDDLSLSTVLYGSWGRGGGTGPRGANYGIYPYKKDLTTAMNNGELPYRTSEGLIDFDAIIANNRAGNEYTGGNGRYTGLILGSNGYNENGVNKNSSIRRASMNSHDWYGAISNLKYEINDWTFGAGLDLRTYKGYHYRVVNDLLGLDGYYSTGNKNLDGGFIVVNTIEAKPFKNTGLETPKIDYYNIGKVKWGGFNGIVEYNNQTLSTVLQAGISSQSYQRIDYLDQPNNIESDTESITGGYVKGGANYNINPEHNVFVNAGYISRQPNFDAVFPNYANNVNDDLQNEKITSFELGYGYRSVMFNANVNLYRTSWKDRWINRGVTVNGVDGSANFKGVEQLHTGVEVDFQLKPISKLTINGMFSAGNWEYKDDVEASVFDDNQQLVGESVLYLDGVKVGDAAQLTSNLGVAYEFIRGFNVDFSWLHQGNLYANFDADDSVFFEEDNEGAVELPSYNLFDLGASYKFNFSNSSLNFRVNVNNLFDEEYIAESNTNYHADSNSELYEGIDKRNTVWFGFGRTWNAGVTYEF